MLRHTKLWLGVVIALAAPAPALVPQLASANSSPSANWVQSAAQGPSAREGASVAYDAARGVTVLFGGGDGSFNLSDTWEFDGNVWTQRQVSGPPARYLAPMIYDSSRRVTVLVGGYGGGILQDVWEWDGAAWTRRFTAHMPPPRDWAAMSYDSRRHVAVLFGGADATGLHNDTWEYDGNDWTQVVTAHAPSARRGMALAFDPIRAKTVLFAGEDSITRVNDTWEYDGVDWAQIALSSAPPVRMWHAMAYDSALTGVVVFGGTTDGNFDYNDTWIYDGVSWQQITGPSAPSVRFWAPAAYDSLHSSLIVFGGAQTAGTTPPLGDVWSLVGTNTLPVNWSKSMTAAAPAARVFAAMDYDSARGVTVLFGGGSNAIPNFADTWEWDGFNWSQRAPATSPPDLVAAAMAYDRRRHVSVLFGGSTGSGLVSSATWEWDGTSWTQRSLSPSPPARTWAAMAYDSTRGRIVLFGGNNSGPLGDTWEYDGNAWTQVNAPTAPSARQGPAMAFDAARNRTVLFGGWGASGRMADTWTWDGTTWTQVSTPTAPYARWAASMAFDPQRGRTVLFGGDHIQPYALGDTNDTWDWDGAQWTRDWTAAAPVIRAGQTMSFDSRRDRMVMFGGGNAAMSPMTLYGDTWELGTGTITPAGSPAATMTPSGLEFGSVDLGASSSGNVAVVSSGTGPLVTSMSITGDFAIAPGTDCPNAPNPLAAGSTCFIFVTFAPSAAGDRAGALTLTGNVAGGSQSVPLHGVGIQQDFTIAANPSSITIQTGAPNPTSTISTAVVGAAGTITLSALTNDPGISATFNPSSITAGTSSTLTIVVAPSVAPGYYGVRAIGTEGAVTHYVDVLIHLIAPPDFTIAASPSSLSIVQGAFDTADITTTAVGTASSVNLSVSVTPTGPSATVSQSTIQAGGLAFLTVSAGYGVAPGNYTVTVTGVEGSFTHSTTVTVAITLKTLINGGFETGDLTGWTATGVVGVDKTTTSHSGSYTAQVGSVSASSDSTLSQTWTVPAAGGKLTFFFYMVCSDKVKNDWFTVTITDGVTGVVSTVQSPICTKAGWNKITVNLNSHAGHFVTVTFLNHDDGNPADPTYTLVDDASFA